jgi:phage host-nuclease inhibitor protein Gam
MQKNSNSMEALSEQLAQKRQQDQEQIQKLTLSELKKLVRSLRAGLKDELDTTKSDTSAQIKEVMTLIGSLETQVSQSSTATRKKLKNDLTEIEKASTRNKAAALNSLKWGWLKYSLPALMVLIVILGGSWGLMRWMSGELVKTNQEIEAAQQTLNSLPAGVEFVRQSEDRYLIFGEKPDLYQAQSGSWVMKLKSQ